MPAAHDLYSGRVALGYNSKKAKQWLDIMWGELADHVHSLLGYLHTQGNRIAIFCTNLPVWTITDLNTQLLGAATAPLYTTLSASRMDYILRDIGAKLLLVSVALCRA